MLNRRTVLQALTIPAVAVLPRIAHAGLVRPQRGVDSRYSFAHIQIKVDLDDLNRSLKPYYWDPADALNPERFAKQRAYIEARNANSKLVKDFRDAVLNITRDPRIYRPCEIRVVSKNGLDWGSSSQDLFLNKCTNEFQPFISCFIKNDWCSILTVISTREHNDRSAQFTEAYELRNKGFNIDLNQYGPEYPTRIKREDIGHLDVRFYYTP